MFFVRQVQTHGLNWEFGELGCLADDRKRSLECSQLLQQPIRVRDAGVGENHRLSRWIVIEKTGLLQRVEDLRANALPRLAGAVTGRARAQHQHDEREVREQLLLGCGARTGGLIYCGSRPTGGC